MYGNRTDGLICQGLPSAIGDSSGVQTTYQCISGAVCGHLRALLADGHGRVGGKQSVHAEAVRVRLRTDPGRRVVVRDFPRLGELPQDDEVAQRARSRLALESLLGEPCHADKIALAGKAFTCGLPGLVHGIAARQHSDDTARAHGGHGPLDHVVMKRHSVDFYRVRVGDVTYGGIKRPLGDLAFGDIGGDDLMVGAKHACESRAHGVDFNAGHMYVHARGDAAHEVARSAARLQNLGCALVTDTGIPQRLPDKFNDGAGGVEGGEDRRALIGELILTQKLFQIP